MTTNTETGRVEVRLTLRGKAILDGKLEKLNRRAKRLGVPPVTVTQLSAWEQVADKVKFADVADGTVPVRRVVDMAYFAITVEVPRLAGWRFLATLEHLDGVNLVKKSPTVSEETNLEAYRTCGPTCEHCNKPRNRADTYVIEHAESTRRMQVGSNCLVDVLGLGVTPEQAAQWAEWVQGLDLASLGGDSDNDGFEGGGSRVINEMPLLSFLGICAALVRVDGYRSKKYMEASEGRATSTAHDALFHYDPPRMEARTIAELRQRYGAFPIEVTDQDTEQAKAAIEWAKAITPKSDFDWNMKTMAGQVMMGLKNAGIAAYLIAGYRRAMELEVERKAKLAALPPSNWVGEIGKRIKGVTVIYLATPYSGETQFGPLFIHKFRDVSGNELVWKTGTSLEHETPGREFKADFTPKAHDEFKGRKQTVVSRLALK